MKQDLHVVSLSGGKDSTAMLLRMLEEGMRADIILFCDTGLEFPEMYRHLEKLEHYTGREITRVCPQEKFEYYLLEQEITAKRDTAYSRANGLQRKGRSWPGPRMRWCTKNLKDIPREQFLRPLRRKFNVIEYVGIAADEGYRLERRNNRRSGCRHPLVEWGMTEADCLRYCYERGFDWDGLYRLFDRVSCWCCPLQSLKELRMLYRHFPKLWEQLKDWDSRTWRNFRKDYSAEQLEKRFDFEEEWQKAGKALRSRAFFYAMKKKLGGDEAAETEEVQTDKV